MREIYTSNILSFQISISDGRARTYHSELPKFVLFLVSSIAKKVAVSLPLVSSNNVKHTPFTAIESPFLQDPQNSAEHRTCNIKFWSNLAYPIA